MDWCSRHGYFDRICLGCLGECFVAFHDAYHWPMSRLSFQECNHQLCQMVKLEYRIGGADV